jgi:hypothetical protein
MTILYLPTLGGETTMSVQDALICMETSAMNKVLHAAISKRKYLAKVSLEKFAVHLAHSMLKPNSVKPEQVINVLTAMETAQMKTFLVEALAVIKSGQTSKDTTKAAAKLADREKRENEMNRKGKNQITEKLGVIKD